MQKAIVILVFVYCVYYLGSIVYKSLFKRKSCCGETDCSKCSDDVLDKE